MFIKRIWRYAEGFLIFILKRRDPLTGLPDRSVLKKIHERKLFEEKISLIFLDLDNFKEINDCLGHQIGDIYLKGFADLLKKEVRDRDFALRWGGDEFVVCLFDVNKEEAENFLHRIKLKTKLLDVTRRADYLRLKEKLKEEDSSSFRNNEIVSSLGVSGGIAEIGDNIFKAISIADFKMYEDKNSNEYSSKQEITDKKVEEIISKEVGREKAKIIVKKLKDNGYDIKKDTNRPT